MARNSTDWDASLFKEAVTLHVNSRSTPALYMNGGGKIMLEAGRVDHEVGGLDGVILKASRALSQVGPVFWVAFYGIALILTIALGTSLMISGVREREISRSEKELQNTVRLLAKQFDEYIENFEGIPKSVATYLASKSSTHEQFKELASSKGLHRLLRDKLSDSETSQG